MSFVQQLPHSCEEFLTTSALEHFEAKRIRFEEKMHKKSEGYWRYLGYE